MCDIYVYIMEYFSDMKKRNCANFNNRDGYWGYSAKWNKPDRRWTLHGINYIWNLKNIKLLETEWKGSCQGLEVVEIREAGKSVQTFSYKMNKFWGCIIRRGNYS